MEHSFPLDLPPASEVEVTLWLRVPDAAEFEARPIVYVDEDGVHALPFRLYGRGHQAGARD